LAGSTVTKESTGRGPAGYSRTVNDVEVGRVEHEGLLEGDAGVFVRLWRRARMDVAFENFSVSAPE
jgi:hypothetical protein